ncbi:MAG TPA: bifunctional homocysteine S-methyltransferase/methylenetetrahydrofolate reductase [Victivallales bacterium]|nr:bifunctional homocysteine S-methyltransferase/methylenetetrahydrofolate reductase [Victivallales bacterium]HRR28007.1 bifunctional homocysteine S-methyltransferase/methylenetetrahydrofolate reductase [Victivallales bacterium]
MKHDITNIIKEKILVFDGAVGTEIYKKNFFVNTCFEELCLSSPNVIKSIHNSYIDAGADIITTNSFGANRNKLSKFGLAEKIKEINLAAAKIARECAGEKIIIAASVGPSGKNDTPQNNSKILEEQSSILAKEADFILFETFSSLDDLESALIAAQKLPIPFAISLAIDENCESSLGEPLNLFLAKIAKFKNQPFAIGLNCGTGPDGMLHSVETLTKMTTLPTFARPNGGLPKNIDGRMIYMTSPEYISTYSLRYVNLGVKAVGGCCGTGPEHIREIARAIKPLRKIEITSKITDSKESVTLLKPVDIKEKSKLSAKLATNQWVASVEIVPPKGFDLTQTIQKAKLCKEAGVDAINIPDGPRASCKISPLVTALKVQEEAGIEAILHFCCRDRNLIGMQADLLACACLGIRNLLFITGDPPKLGEYPFASGVFDADSITMAKIQDRLNRGVDIGGKSINGQTKAFIGVGADPNAIDIEREIRRLREKKEAGAEFIITQPVFAVEPLLKFIDRIKDLNLFIIAGIWPLASTRNAEFMKNEVPGVVVPDEIIYRMRSHESKEAQFKEGIKIAIETIQKIKEHISGIQVSAPFGRIEGALEVINASKN